MRIKRLKTRFDGDAQKYALDAGGFEKTEYKNMGSVRKNNFQDEITCIR